MDMKDRTDLGECSDVEAVAALVPLAGLKVVDIGCGPGHLSRALRDRGAAVTGVEPDPIQAERNRQAPAEPGLRLVEARAEALPLESGSQDGAFFFRSLHHVPAAAMAAALAEAARVVRPGGFLCVVEPGMTGSHYALIRPFHDETEVRIRAQAALDGAAAGLFRERRACRYVQYPSYPDFGSLVARFTSQTFNDIRRERVESDEVRALFEAGRTPEGGFVFEQPMLLDLFRDRLA